MAVLRAQGFDHLHLVHGQAEFGKDVIAQRDSEQWAWQSKAGNISQAGWRDIKGQLDELRLSDLSHPSFDVAVPRRCVLVTTGRLTGNAPLLAQEYSKQATERGEPELEIWDRDRLLGLFSGNPDAVLRGSVDGQVLGMLGAIDRREVSMTTVEEFCRRWATWEPDRVASLGIVEAAICCERLRGTDRLDLACHMSLCALAGAWATEGSGKGAETAADAAATLFEHYARALWAGCDERLLREKGLVGYSGFGAWVTYPVRCSRVAEILALFALRQRDADPALSGEISAWVAEFVVAQPGIAHLVGDRYAVGLIPVSLLLVDRPEVHSELLTRVTIWLCDRYESGELGLAAAGAPEAEEIQRIFGSSFEHLGLTPRRASQVAGVLLDLAAILGLEPLYADIRNDVLAVSLFPIVLLCPDGPDQFLARGFGNRWDYNPDYAEVLSAAGKPAAPHLEEGPADRALTQRGRWWDLLAVSSALRDRHFVSALRAASPPKP